MAAGHYQFEAIHPFTDGNGPTGRIIKSLYLISEGLLTLPILYLSRYFIENRISEIEDTTVQKELHYQFVKPMKLFGSLFFGFIVFFMVYTVYKDISTHLL